jgi:beta-phosphoglucomutase-like phosphatase (HAD superfamily)
MIDTVIFDMDGVLIDAKNWHFEALNMALKIFGETISDEEHMNHFDGLTTKQKLELLNKSKRIPEGLNQLINTLKQQFTTELVATKCEPNFEHQLALSKLKENGFKLGLASNSIRETVELMLKRAQIYEFFDVTLSNNDVTNPKPHPEIYLKAIDKLDTIPTRTLVIEDNQHGIEAAKLAGAHVLKVDTVKDVHHLAIMQAVSEVDRCKS